MVKVTTDTGFECTIEDEVLDDYEIFENLVEYEKGNYGMLSDILKSLLGEEQMKALKEHCRDGKGKVRTTKVVVEFSAIMAAVQKESKAVKN